MDNQKSKKTVIDKIWDIFASVKFAVIIFSIISLTSIIGTIVEQNGEPQKNIKILSSIVGDSLAPTIFNILDALNFTRMYNSLWFMLLLFIFASNIIICSIERLPRVLKILKEPIKPLSQEQLETLKISNTITLNSPFKDVLKKIEPRLKIFNLKWQSDKSDSFVQFYGEKGKFGKLGVYGTHLSVLIILLGAIIGMKFGFNANLNLLEGKSSSIVYMSNENEIPLGFEIKCNDFDVSFYDNSDTPKSFKSWLTILENGKPIIMNNSEIQEIEVNIPLTYKGITFYQSSYGFAPTKDSLFKFKVKGKDIAVKFNEIFDIPDTQIKARVLDFSPSIAVDEQGNPFTYSPESMNNPAVFLEFQEKEKIVYSQWILKRQPTTWNTDYGVIKFIDLWGAQYTGLQVRKDNGVWIVYLGCIIMSISLYIAFFIHHIKIWIHLTPIGNKTKIRISLISGKNKFLMENKVDKFLKEISNNQK